MANADYLPNCFPWKPEDKILHADIGDFLTELFNRGFRTFTAKGGLGGAMNGHRIVDVIHRGMRRKWEIGFIDHENMKHKSMVGKPLVALDMCVEWLNGGIEDKNENASNVVEGK